MMNGMDDYYYYVVWSEEDKQYAGLCDEFPNLCWLEPFVEDALKGIRRCVAEVLADIDPIPAAPMKETLPL
jgi:hypothetical protein